MVRRNHPQRSAAPQIDAILVASIKFSILLPLFTTPSNVNHNWVVSEMCVDCKRLGFAKFGAGNRRINGNQDMPTSALYAGIIFLR